MDQIDKPRGLIRYATENELAGGPRRYFRLRTAVYGAILAVLIAGLAYAVSIRDALDIKFIRAVDSPYTETTLADGSVQVFNHYRVNLKNQVFDSLEVSLSLLDDAVDAGIELVAPTYPLTVEGGDVIKNSVFFKFPAELTRGTGRHPATIVIRATGTGGNTTLSEEISLIGPFS
jgi:polyferredoxin